MSRNAEIKAIAEDCRRLAAMVKDEAVRLQLLAVAQNFERLARPHPQSPGLDRV